MSALRIFRPTDEPAVDKAPDPSEPDVSSESDGPVLLSFADWVDQLRGHPVSATQRARAIHANTSCPCCLHAAVVPLMLNDGRVDSAGQIIPGTATLVGFRCGQCEHEWLASQGSRPSVG